jgi:glycosyltransferase involved in cell wall biosynthesis
LAWIGRLVRTKKPEDALSAFFLIQQALPEARLDMVGDGYLRSSLERTAPRGAVLHGYVSSERKHQILSEADLLLAPGTREGWGMTVIEAALHGVPTVAYDIPGLRDSVVDGVTGRLVAPTPDQLASAAIDLLHDPSALRSLGLQARNRAKGFTWQRCAEDLLAIVQRDV